MILALSAMDPTVQGILFLVAVILFIVAALWGYRPGVERDGRSVGLVPLGLAFFSFVFMWQAFAAS